MEFYDRLAPDYEAWSRKAPRDIGFYVDLALQSAGRIIELAVGEGRVAVPVAKATGQQVVGIDSSPAMLERARANAAAAGVELDLRMGDLCDLAVDGTFGFIYCPGRSLLHVPTWAFRRQLFERVAAALEPGGRFAWNAFALDHHLASQLDGVHQDRPTPHVSSYDVIDNRVDMVLDSGETGSLWWATKNEWLGLIDVAGLDLESLHGDFAGSLPDSSSREYVFVARKA